MTIREVAKNSSLPKHAVLRKFPSIVVMKLKAKLFQLASCIEYKKLRILESTVGGCKIVQNLQKRKLKNVQ